MSDSGKEEVFPQRPAELNLKLHEFIERLPHSFHDDGSGKALEEDPEGDGGYESERYRRNASEFTKHYKIQLKTLLDMSKVTPTFKEKIENDFDWCLGYGIRKPGQSGAAEERADNFPYADFDKQESGGIFDWERARELEAEAYYKKKDEVAKSEESKHRLIQKMREQRGAIDNYEPKPNFLDRSQLSNWAKEYEAHYGVNLDGTVDILV